MPKVIGVIRTRGTVKVPRNVKVTLERMKLNRRHSMLIQYDSPTLRGMIKAAEPYLAWGEVDRELLVNLLSKRGRFRGGRRLGADELKLLGCSTIEELADSILEKGELKKHVANGLSNVFGLTPPSGGFKADLHRPASQKGVWGAHEHLTPLVAR
ncbi:MAG: uL30 family ribosomal protein, partial [Thermoprotei archaeon]